MARLEYNTELEKGDRVICIRMDDDYSPVSTGMQGTVTHKSVVFGDLQYNVNWDNGSKLALISGVDKWAKAPKKKTDESVRVVSKKNFIKENFYQKNTELFKYFNHRLLFNYLKVLRETGITNMFGASPYLYMGKEMIKHENYYKDIPNEEVYEKLLEMADEVREEMISGAVLYAEENNMEVNPRRISRIIEDFARKMTMSYFQMAGGRLPS